jgi:peroxiredoxin Q/BCP
VTLFAEARAPRPDIEEDEMIEQGSKAPAFSLVADNGNKIALKDFAGRSVVLYFYPKDATPG